MTAPGELNRRLVLEAPVESADGAGGVTLGDARIEDFSAGSDPAHEHRLTLHAWSRQGGHKEAHTIAGALLQALDDAPLAPAGHRLVNLRFSVADIRREADGRTYHALVRFRAVTEPA